MGQSTDQIRQEIDQSRSDAAEKIDRLQSQVQDTAQEMRDNVQGTADQVIQQVKGTVDETVESVKANLDVRQQIEQRPLLSLGVAFVGGFMLGGLTGGGSDHQHRGYQENRYAHGGYESGDGSSAGNPYAGHVASPPSSGTVGQGLRSAIQKTGLEDTISSAAAAMIGSLTDQLKNTLDQNFPGFADKMSTAQQSSDDFAGKAKDAQSPTNRSAHQV